jgi:hypothetical protein
MKVFEHHMTAKKALTNSKNPQIFLHCYFNAEGRCIRWLARTGAAPPGCRSMELPLGHGRILR